MVYHLTSYFLLYLQNYKEFEAEILDLQLEKYGLSCNIKKYTTSSWALGDENVISIRSFNEHKSTERNFPPLRFSCLYDLKVSGPEIRHLPANHPYASEPQNNLE